MTNITAQKREILGRKVKGLREEGMIPAELYGKGEENVHLSVSEKDFIKLFKEAGETSVLKLKIQDGGKEGKDINVLIHDVSRDPLNDKILHVDFYQVRMDEKIRTEVPVQFIGDAPAIKEKNGVLIKAIQEIEVEALPADLPQHIEVDLSGLTDIGSNIYIKDIKISKGVKIFVDPENVIATITEQAKEEVAPQPVSVEDVKVEGEEKKAEAAKAEAEGGEKKEEEKK